jgi:hypothetical protein
MVENLLPNRMIPVLGKFENFSEFNSLTICPLHCDEFGTRWKTGKVSCCIPNTISTHPDRNRKGDKGVSFQYALKVHYLTGIHIQIGARKFRFAIFKHIIRCTTLLHIMKNDRFC